MHLYLSQILTIALLHLLAVLSPGPDFVLITKNSLVYSRRTGIFTALGLALGIIVHITYSLVGIGYIISQSIIVFSILKTIGAAYLIYIGYKSLRAKPAPEAATDEVIEMKSLGKFEAIKTGFLTNVLNPKATLFFLAIFTQVISSSTPIGIKAVMGLEMSAMTFAWFSVVALLLSHPAIQRRFARIQHYVERTMGLVLIALGIKVLVTRGR